MRNKFHKLLSMFLVMLIVINQFGNITVLAESLAEQPERSLTIEVDQEEAALGEQFQLRVRGTPDLLNALVIDKSEDLIEGEVKQLNDYERLITYSSQHSGKYELTARSGDIQSNTVSIEISVPEESTSESFNVPEESTSESFNIPEESLSESFNEARSSEPSITQESQIERQEELLNYDIGISAERPTLPSRHTQTLKGYIQGGAGDILEEYGEMVVRVPRASIGLIEFIRVEVADDSPLKPLAFYQEGTDVVFPFTFDYEGLNEAAQSYTFSITFEVAFFQSGGTEPNNDFQVSLTYAERAANTEFSITPIPSSRPIFSKLYYGSREIDSQGNLGNLLIDGQDVTNSNKFILQVNYEGSRKDGVVVTDVLPQGTTLAPNPTTWSSTGNREPISGGVRIAEVTNPGEANVRTHYVSEEFVDKVSFNKETNTLVVDFGNLAEGQSYFIEYALEVTDVDLFNEGRQEDGFSRNRASMTYNNQVMSRDYRLRIPESNLPAISLRKSVDKNVINLNENELTYTLHVSMFSGTSNTLVIEDVLEEGMEFVSFLSDIPSFIDAEVNNGIVRFSANNTIGGPTSFTLSFKVNVEAYAVGDQILNFATLVNSDNRLNTSTVRTRKIDGRIKVIKTDENGQRLAGAKFEILSSDSQVIQEGITAENGEFLSEPLPVGSYQVRETEAPEGYLLDATVHDVFINEYSIEEVTLTIENILDTGGVELIKHAEGSGEVLQGAVFELQNREGETLQTGLTTGEDGKLAIDGLAPGAYQLVETQAPIGYELDATPIEFEIERSQTAVVELTKENRLTPGGVVLTKIDDQSGEILQGAVFELQNREGETLQTGLTTGEDGKLAIDGLAPGAYQLVETQAPIGYELDATPIEFEIERSQTAVVELTKENRLTPGGVVLTKIDDQSGEILQGAVFELQNREGETLQTGLTTGEDGKLAIDGLAPGAYQLVETQAPIGYELDATPIEFEIERSQTAVVELTKENRLTPGGVVLTKIDDQSGEILQGAVFELQNREGETLQTGLTTGEDGKLAIDGLAPGAYQLVETQAPTGYELDATPIEFEIERSQTAVVELTKANRLTPGGVVLTKIDDQSGELLQGAVFELQDANGTVLQSGLTRISEKGGGGGGSPGVYQLVETQAPIGYELDATPIEFEIERSQTAVVELTKENRLTPGGVVLTKIDDQSGEVLQGAVFELQDANGTVLQSGLTTGADGKLAISGLAPGVYQLVETQAPIGYELDATPIEFEIERSQTAVVELTKENRLTPGGVVLTKIDDQSGEVLQGAVFELQDANGTVLQSGLTTGADGKLAIDGLAPGAYQLVETQAPTGYELDATPVTFKIEKEQEVAIFLTKENRKVADSSDIRGNNPTSSGNKHLPKTGETIISQFILSILGVLLVFISIKFRKKRNI
ncbi:SpaA isopeptide-forming pilin-related protein [Enterococcus faecium]|uniref:MSCRAMM family protein n=1 Tax=Enterococcus faecium TaxID=1352 RepID=UPI0021ADBEDB|nr:SpaA isopeptide-forming pilin-related protein [Enterococcus faecium]UWS52726.1 SpaA isopeptide-forming pilin-related protein [Enterococcus faecium]